MRRRKRRLTPRVERMKTYNERLTSDIFFYCDQLNFKPSHQQRELFQCIQDETFLPLADRKKRVAIKSGQGPGKTIASNIIGSWRALQLPDHGLTMVTAPTQRQCEKVWIASLRQLLDGAKPGIRDLFTCYKSSVEICGQEGWRIDTATATRPQNLQGLHRDNLTFILDEGSGVAEPIWETIFGTVTNFDSLVVAIGNPNTRDGEFFKCFTRDRSLWHTFTWNAEDVPHIVDPSNINRMAQKYGRDSDAFRIRVLGEFPTMDPRCIMNVEDLEACTRVPMTVAAGRRDVLKTNKAFGIDFARFGGDENVLVVRSGLAIIDWDFWSHVEPDVPLNEAFRRQQRLQWDNSECWYVPDATGVGQGMMRDFVRADKQYLEFHNHGTSSDSQFENKISEAWFNFGELVRQRIVHIPDDGRMIEQLSTRQYYTTKKGKLEVETKDEYMKRGHDSPDRADAVVMAFYDRMTASGQVVGRQDPRHKIGSSTRRRQ
ncbi:MAG TPA: hypothetical protein VMX57_05845 [Planctomycetota bacterium]|nr:hypothetical protein [Planctomycetota bacterium]